MKRVSVSVIVAGGVAVALAAPGQAETVIGSTNVGIGGSGQAVFDSLHVSYGMGADFGFIEIFFVEDLEIDGSDIGTTWVSDPASVALIRNQWQDADNIDLIGVGARLVEDPFMPFFFTGLPEANFPLAGLDLTTLAAETDEIRVTLQSIAFDTPGDDPNGDGIWTNYTADFLFEFVSLPTPGAAALFAVCGLFARTSRRRRA